MGNLFLGTDSCTTLLSFRVEKMTLLQDNQYLFLFVTFVFIECSGRHVFILHFAVM